jgi:uncharacterized protein
MSLQFEWSESKAEINLKKHNVSFEEAKSVFYDDFARIFYDSVHSDNEEREMIIGYSNKNRLIIVSYTERNSRIRLISARKITTKERKLYEEFYK